MQVVIGRNIVREASNNRQNDIFFAYLNIKLYFYILFLLATHYVYLHFNLIDFSMFTFKQLQGRIPPNNSYFSLNPAEQEYHVIQIEINLFGYHLNNIYILPSPQTNIY